jgi:hypothetical protein
LFELLVGAGCSPFADELSVESPEGKTKVKTPDVTLTWKRRRWGIACKVLQSTKPERYRDQVLKGIWQIDQCDVDRGIVMINVKNLIPLETFMPFGRKSQAAPYEIYMDGTWTEHIEAFRKELRKRVEAEQSDISKAFQTSRIAGRASVVCHYAQSMAWVMREGEPRMTPFVLVDPRFFSVFEPSHATHEFLRQLCGAMSWANGGLARAEPEAS